MARILVIDDNEDVRAVVAGVLESAGHEVAQAGDGQRGIELQRSAPAELVISDILMPEKEGIETLRDLRKEFPGLKLIAMSGGSERIQASGYLVTAKEMGAQVTLRKPFQAATLLEAVDRVLADGKRQG